MKVDSLFQKQEYLKNLAWIKLFELPYLIGGIVGFYTFTVNLKVIKSNREIGSCSRSFGPSIENWEITGT